MERFRGTQIIPLRNDVRLPKGAFDGLRSEPRLAVFEFVRLQMLINKVYLSFEQRVCLFAFDFGEGWARESSKVI